MHLQHNFNASKCDKKNTSLRKQCEVPEILQHNSISETFFDIHKDNILQAFTMPS